MQEDTNNQVRRVAYVSRKLKRAEQTYSVTLQEALKHIKVSGYKFRVITDRGSITQRFNARA